MSVRYRSESRTLQDSPWCWRTPTGRTAHTDEHHTESKRHLDPDLALANPQLFACALPAGAQGSLAAGPLLKRVLLREDGGAVAVQLRDRGRNLIASAQVQAAG